MLVRLCDDCGGIDDVQPVAVDYHPMTKTVDLCAKCRREADLRRLAQEARREREQR